MIITKDGCRFCELRVYGLLTGLCFLLVLDTYFNKWPMFKYLRVTYGNALSSRCRTCYEDVDFVLGSLDGTVPRPG